MSAMNRSFFTPLSCAYTENAATADFMKKVPSVYTHSMTTIYIYYIYPSAQVAEGTIFRKSPVAKGRHT